MRFQERLAAGLNHEQRVIHHLKERGWQAEPFGQALLTEEMRGLVRHTRSPVRWLPDIIAARCFSSGMTAAVIVIFIDAKGGAGWMESGNHIMETAAVESAQQFATFAGCQVFFVFDDGRMLTPDAALTIGEHRPGSKRGSGTPFVLVQASRCRHIDELPKLLGIEGE